MRFIPARHFTPSKRMRVDLVVLHSMESSERLGTAANVAQWFAGPDAPQASAHYCVDQDEVIQCVKEIDVAWHAPGANRTGIGIEHAGRASQTPEQWADEYSAKMLRRSVNLAAGICLRWNIEPTLVGPLGLVKGHGGITTHAFVTLAFKKSTHTDPGVGFPLEEYINRVARVVSTGVDEEV